MHHSQQGSPGFSRLDFLPPFSAMTLHALLLYQKDTNEVGPGVSQSQSKSLDIFHLIILDLFQSKVKLWWRVNPLMRLKLKNQAEHFEIRKESQDAASYQSCQCQNISSQEEKAASHLKDEARVQARSVLPNNLQRKNPLARMSCRSACSNLGRRGREIENKTC